MLMPAHHHSPSITRRIRQQQQLHRSVYIYIPTAFLVPPLYSSAGRRGVVLSVDLHTRNRFPLIAPHLSLFPIRMYKRRTLKLTTIIFFLVPQNPPKKTTSFLLYPTGGKNFSRINWNSWRNQKESGRDESDTKITRIQGGKRNPNRFNDVQTTSRRSVFSSSSDQPISRKSESGWESKRFRYRKGASFRTTASSRHGQLAFLLLFFGIIYLFIYLLYSSFFLSFFGFLLLASLPPAAHQKRERAYPAITPWNQLTTI